MTRKLKKIIAAWQWLDLRGSCVRQLPTTRTLISPATGRLLLRMCQQRARPGVCGGGRGSAPHRQLVRCVECHSPSGHLGAGADCGTFYGGLQGPVRSIEHDRLPLHCGRREESAPEVWGRHAQVLQVRTLAGAVTARPCPAVSEPPLCTKLCAGALTLTPGLPPRDTGTRCVPSASRRTGVHAP